MIYLIKKKRFVEKYLYWVAHGEKYMGLQMIVILIGV